MATQESIFVLPKLKKVYLDSMKHKEVYLCKYIWTPCLGERLLLRADVGNAYISYASFGDERWHGGGPHANDQLLYMIAVFI